MSDIVKNQHYIPRCILKNFSNKKHQVFEALVEEGKHYITNYSASMVEKYTYEHPQLKQNFLEKEFQKVENIIAPAINELIETIESYESADCRFNEIKKCIESIIDIVIIFYYRSGALLHEYSFERDNKDDRIDLLLDNILRSSYIHRLGKTLIGHYSFAIIKSENKDFLMSDQYVSTCALRIKSQFANLSNRHMGLRDVMILIPVSSTYYVVFFHGKRPDYINKNRINLLSAEQVGEINNVIINNSYLKCISYNEKALLDALKSFEFSSPSGTYMGFNSGAVSGATLKKEIFFYNSDQELWEFFRRYDWKKYDELKRNDICVCGSNKKFKNCCKDLYQGAERIMNDIEISQKKNDITSFVADPKVTVERPIGEFYSAKGAREMEEKYKFNI